MIIIPTGTDAPIYHWPYATVGMILINIALFIVVPPGSSTEPCSDARATWWSSTQAITTFERYALALSATAGCIRS